MTKGASLIRYIDCKSRACLSWTFSILQCPSYFYLAVHGFVGEVKLSILAMKGRSNSTSSSATLEFVSRLYLN